MKIINKTLIGLTLVFALLFASSQTFVGYKSGDFALNINKTFATGDGGDAGDGGGGDGGDAGDAGGAGDGGDSGMIYVPYTPTCYAPTAALASNPMSIISGGLATLNWSSSNATSCTLSGGSISTGGIYGYLNIYPSQTTTYTLTCSNSCGTVIKNVTVSVSAATCTNGATNYPSCNNNYCTNGATNFPSCNICPTNYIMSNGQCVYHNPVCTNGATNYPSCNICPTNYVYLNGNCTYQTPTCTNGATNYPLCNNNYCTNGATNYPSCNICPTNYVMSNGQCVYQTPTCNNGATNPPYCNICPTNYIMSNGQCVYHNPTCSNGATNYPYCNNNVCTNGATNFPSCNICTTGKVYINGYCQIQIVNPTATIYVGPSTVLSGNPTTLTWNSNNASSCMISGNGVSYYTTTGSQTIYPTQSGTYTITCQGVNGGSATAQTYITVTQPMVNPTANIDINPKYITAGQAATLSWASTNASSCMISGNGVSYYTTQGNNVIYPTQSGTYTITCQGINGGSASDSTYINVTQPVQTCNNGATNYPYCNNNTCTNGATNFPSCNNNITYVWCNGVQYQAPYTCPIIVNNPPTVTISPSQYSVNAGTGVNLTWSSTNATYCTAGNNIFSGSKNTAGTEWISNLQNTTTFTITCYNTQGQSATAYTTVSVNPVQQYVYCNGVQYPAGAVCPNTNTLAVSTTGANPFQTTATLNGYVNPNGVYPTTIWFEYGTNANYLNYSTNKVNTSTTGQYTGNLTNLECGKTYYYRAVGTNSNGTRYGNTLSFVTAACPVYIPNIPVQTNNSYVITNMPTNVGYNNAQFNGSWVPGNTNNQLCQAYFNYGTSMYNLNKRTSTQEVYNNQTTAYMSQAAYGLVPNTTYYYRSAVTCLDGTKYGQILSFRTLTSYVYKQTVKKVYIPAPITKVVQSKAGCTNCAEYTQNLQNVVNVISGNYMDLVIERLESVAVSGQNANYRVVYKNISDKTLQDVSVRLVLPDELSIVNAERGQYNVGGKTLVITMPVMNPLEEGRFMITTKVGTGFENGRQIVLNGYGQYSVVENNKLTKDEVTAYAMSQVGDAQAINTTVNNTNNAITAGTGLSGIFGNLFSGNLIELILLLVILTLFVAVLRYVWTAFGRSTMK